MAEIGKGPNYYNVKRLLRQDVSHLGNVHDRAVTVFFLCGVEIGQCLCSPRGNWKMNLVCLQKYLGDRRSRRMWWGPSRPFEKGRRSQGLYLFISSLQDIHNEDKEY